MLRNVPNYSGAARLAEETRSGILGAHAKERLADFRRVAHYGRFRIVNGPLDAKRGRLEGLLVPLDDDYFGISVDPSPKGGWRTVDQHLRGELRRHRTRFRVAHEVAHSFFYRRRAGASPERCVFDSPQQERFCDDFARAFLVPHEVAAAIEPSAPVVHALHRYFDVSLELAARAAARAHPDIGVALFYSSDAAETRVQWVAGPHRREWYGEARKLADEALHGGRHQANVVPSDLSLVCDPRRRQAVVTTAR